jgi:hypothetical protein
MRNNQDEEDKMGGQATEVDDYEENDAEEIA